MLLWFALIKRMPVAGILCFFDSRKAALHPQKNKGAGRRTTATNPPLPQLFEKHRSLAQPGRRSLR